LRPTQLAACAPVRPVIAAPVPQPLAEKSLPQMAQMFTDVGRTPNKTLKRI
jgi:hypothetical protein